MLTSSLSPMLTLALSPRQSGMDVDASPPCTVLTSVRGPKHGDRLDLTIKQRDLGVGDPTLQEKLRSSVPCRPSERSVSGYSLTPRMRSIYYVLLNHDRLAEAGKQREVEDDEGKGSEMEGRKERNVDLWDAEPFPSFTVPIIQPTEATVLHHAMLNRLGASADEREIEKL